MFVMLESRLKSFTSLKVSRTKEENWASADGLVVSHCDLEEKESRKSTTDCKGEGKINLILREISERGLLGSF